MRKSKETGAFAETSFPRLSSLRLSHLTRYVFSTGALPYVNHTRVNVHAKRDLKPTSEKEAIPVWCDREVRSLCSCCSSTAQRLVNSDVTINVIGQYKQNCCRHSNNKCLEAFVRMWKIQHDSSLEIVFQLIFKSDPGCIYKTTLISLSIDFLEGADSRPNIWILIFWAPLCFYPTVPYTSCVQSVRKMYVY